MGDLQEQTARAAMAQPRVITADPGVQVEQEPVRWDGLARDTDGVPWWIHDCGQVAESNQRPGPHACDSCGNAPGPWAPLWVRPGKELDGDFVELRNRIRIGWGWPNKAEMDATLAVLDRIQQQLKGGTP